MQFEWDEQKEKYNIVKHGLDFETAVRVSENNRAERRKQTVTLRLSPQALRTAKSLGKGYTSVLSRILENALADVAKLFPC